MRRVYVALVMCVMASCADAGGANVSIPVFARGAEPTPFVAGTWTVTLAQAEVVFGPLWLCAAEGDQASCETARMVNLNAFTVNLLESEAQPVGALQGVEGSVGTYWFDYGVVSLLTQDEPLILPPAEALGGSVRLIGTAQKGGLVVAFDILLTVSQTAGNVERGVPVVRRASDDIAHIVDSSTQELGVEFDPSLIFVSVNFDDLAGVTDVVVRDNSSTETAQIASAVRQALQGRAVPRFIWVQEPRN